MSAPVPAARSVRASERTRWAAWSSAVLVVLLLIVLSLCVGAYRVASTELLRILASPLSGTDGTSDPTAATVVWQIRLPRVLAAFLVGAALASAGAAYQASFRNPLVSPDILGVSAGASLGAMAGIFLSLPVAAIQGMSFAGGLVAVGLVYALSVRLRGRDPVLVLVLAGIAVGALLTAALSLPKILADPYDQLPAIICWLLGSLTGITVPDVAAVPVIAVGLVPLVALRWRVNLLSLGEEEARSLGIRPGPLRLALVAGATLVTSACVSVSGIVGWVGLLLPHVARMLVWPDFRRLLPASLLLGGGYLVLIDTFARTIARIEVPLGILTAAVGAPFFVWLLARSSRGR